MTESCCPGGMIIQPKHVEGGHLDSSSGPPEQLIQERGFGAIFKCSVSELDSYNYRDQKQHETGQKNSAEAVCQASGSEPIRECAFKLHSKVGCKIESYRGRGQESKGFDKARFESSESREANRQGGSCRNPVTLIAKVTETAKNSDH